MSNNKRLLISHLKRHSPERPFPCYFPGCAYLAKWSQLARAHERNVHGFNRFENVKSNKAGRWKPTSGTMESRRLELGVQIGEIVQGSSPLTKKLEWQVPTKIPNEKLVQLALEMAAGKKSSEKIGCPQCGVKYYARVLQHHLMVHNDEKPYVCAVKGCEYRTRWPGDLKAHMKRHERAVNKRQRFSSEILAQPDGAFHCKDCDYMNKNKRLLLSHVRRHSDERPFPCTFPGCAYRSKWSHWARAHERKVHHITRSQQMKYKVQQRATRALTNVKFPRVQVTKLVQKSRTKETETTLSRANGKCPQYEGKGYRYFLQNHLKVNYGEKPFGCSVKGCNYRTKWLKLLKNHKTRCGKVSKQLLSSARKKPLVVVQPEVAMELDVVYDDSDMEEENYMEISMEPAEELGDSIGFACTLCDFVGYSEAAALNHAKSHTQPFFSHDKLNEIPTICLE